MRAWTVFRMQGKCAGRRASQVDNWEICCRAQQMRSAGGTASRAAHFVLRMADTAAEKKASSDSVESGCALDVKELVQVILGEDSVDY